MTNRDEYGPPARDVLQLLLSSCEQIRKEKDLTSLPEQLRSLDDLKEIVLLALEEINKKDNGVEIAKTE